MNINDRYKINRPQVISDLLDGELIIIKLDTGVYYSTEGSGALIWDLIERGASVRQIASTLLTHYSGDPMEVPFAIAPYFDRLVENHLISPRVGEVAEVNLPAAPEKILPFAAPKIEIYRDIQNLLLIDPIHGVNEDHGWPVA